LVVDFVDHADAGGVDGDASFLFVVVEVEFSCFAGEFLAHHPGAFE